MNSLECAWLTLNRMCNLRCNWCYAKGTNFSPYQNMKLEFAKELIDFCEQLNINEIALIGGEPTCYDNLEELILYISSKRMESWLITNGLKFQDELYLENLILSGLTGINFSFKGWSRTSYIRNTNVDAFDRALVALQNVCNSGVKCKVSFVLNCDNISHIIDIVQIAKNHGASEYYFSFEHDFSIFEGNEPDIYNINKVSKLIYEFSHIYSRLDNITDGKFILHQSFPICMWDKNTIDKLTQKKQIYTSCSLIRRSGITFDTDGSLIPCNAMYRVPVGKYNVDFNDVKTFNSFWNSSKILSFYDSLKKLPSEKCSSCNNALICGGGCISNWYHFSFDDLLRKNLIKSFNTK